MRTLYIHVEQSDDYNVTRSLFCMGNTLAAKKGLGYPSIVTSVTIAGTSKREEYDPQTGLQVWHFALPTAVSTAAELNFGELSMEFREEYSDLEVLRVTVHTGKLSRAIGDDGDSRHSEDPSDELALERLIQAIHVGRFLKLKQLKLYGDGPLFFELVERTSLRQICTKSDIALSVFDRPKLVPKFPEHEK
jgi:hypothetical protein